MTDIPPCGSLADQLGELDAKCTPVQPAVLLRLADQVRAALVPRLRGEAMKSAKNTSGSLFRREAFKNANVPSLGGGSIHS